MNIYKHRIHFIAILVTVLALSACSMQSTEQSNKPSQQAEAEMSVIQTESAMRARELELDLRIIQERSLQIQAEKREILSERLNKKQRKRQQKNGMKILSDELQSLLEGDGKSYSKAYKAREKPKSHIWQYIYVHGDEDRGFGTYSYVLAGRDANDYETSRRYLSLIKAIQSSTSNKKEIPKITNLAVKGKYNLFLIPAVKNVDKHKMQPNYSLSKSLISVLAVNSELTLERPGPFIITLLDPISYSSEDIMDILYFDFTGIDVNAIPEIIRTYKTHIVNSELTGLEKLESFRLSLLNLALNLEASIGFAKVAYAELRKKYIDEPEKDDKP